MNELVQIVSNAFSPMPLLQVIALERAAGANDEQDGRTWGAYPHAKEFEAHLAGKSWDMLEPEFLELHHDALPCLSPDAFAALIPAYLVAYIQTAGEPTLLSFALIDALTRSRHSAVSLEVFDARAERLSEPQRAAISRALEQLAQSPSHSFSQSMIVTARDSYWRYVPVISLDDLVAPVAGAFPPKPLYDRSAFEFSTEPGAGAWGGYLHTDELEAHLQDRTWDMLEPEFLERHHDALAYVSPAAFAAVLPAYLVAYIRHAETLNMLPEFLLDTLTRSSASPSYPEIFDARVGRLTVQQRAAVARALVGLARSPRHLELQPKIEAALDSYWRDVP